MRAPWLAVLVAGAVACSAEPEAPGHGADPALHGAGPEAEVVLARVGSPALPAAVRPALEASPRKLDVRTRHAVSGKRPFELSVPPGATRLRFSQACVPAPEDGPVSTAHFRIGRRRTGGAGWNTLHAQEFPADGRWRDHTVPLPYPGAEDRALRFGIRAAPGCEPLWGSVLLLGPDPARGGAPARPNVVLVSLDTLGAAYLGAFSGREDVSPRLDAFLSGSASFRRAFAQYGNTLVSHASLFSALHPRHHGVYAGEGLPKPLPSSLVERLAAAGWHTAAFTEGAFVSAAFGFARGFDHYDDGAIGLSRQMAGGAEATFERAASWIEAHGGDERFLLFLHTYEVHSPYLPPEGEALEVAGRLTPEDARLPSREEQARQILLHNTGREKLPPRDVARLRALHVAEIHALDGVVGRFLARLEARGLAPRTLVVITSDHGDQFGEHDKLGHGDSLHDRVLHVPLGFRWPGVIAPRWIDTPVQLVDVMPTVLDLVGMPVPDALDGASLARALTRGETPPARPAFSEQRSARGECARLGLPASCRLDRLAVHDGSWKLVTSELPPWQRLYDLASDPLEERDVKQAHPEKTRRLASLLERYRQDTRPSSGATGEGALPGGAGRAAPELDADTRERLRALGYAEPGEATPPADDRF